MTMLATLLSLISAAQGALHLVRLRTPGGLGLWLPKLLAEALSAHLALLGAAGSVLALIKRRPLAALTGVVGAWLSARYVGQTVISHGDFDSAFGSEWQSRIPEARKATMLQRRWTWLMPRAPEPRWDRDVAFWTLPGSERQLLCDVWQPPDGVTLSGLTILYMHGSAWCLSDKDVGTRTFFRHLAGQGHVMVDVAYRLCPEVDIRGMIGDVRRAVAWIKACAGVYGVDPERVVLGGASAGGHLALLAAYTPGHPDLTPEELEGQDLSVRAVFSFYGPTDLRALRGHVGRIPGSSRLPSRLSGGPEAGAPARFAVPRGHGLAWGRSQVARLKVLSTLACDLLGGFPDEVPAAWEIASPVTHVDAGCPPTMLIHGGHDILVPASAGRSLHLKLLAAGVPVVYLELPQTEHAFDLVLPRTSPPAQGALYDLERFLALVG